MISSVPDLRFSTWVQQLQPALPLAPRDRSSPESGISAGNQNSSSTTVTLSESAQAAASSEAASKAAQAPVAKSAASGSAELTAEEQQQVTELAKIDQAVRAHERAHLGAGAGLVLSGPSFEYTTGPDGKRYAVGGDVHIDASSGRTPEETLAKAQQLRAAALAPADPSAQDQRVAALASQMESEARIELMRKNSGGEAEGKPADSAQVGANTAGPAAALQAYAHVADQDGSRTQGFQAQA